MMTRSLFLRPGMDACRHVDISRSEAGGWVAAFERCALASGDGICLERYPRASCTQRLGWHGMVWHGIGLVRFYAGPDEAQRF
jgi:hypothetical protein